MIVVTFRFMNIMKPVYLYKGNSDSEAISIATNFIRCNYESSGRLYQKKNNRIVFSGNIGQSFNRAEISIEFEFKE